MSFFDPKEFNPLFVSILRKAGGRGVLFSHHAEEAGRRYEYDLFASFDSEDKVRDAAAWLTDEVSRMHVTRPSVGMAQEKIDDTSFNAHFLVSFHFP